mmetsp:Transcript_60289/g.197180  ORF Transcript_60289/g.197180 Transcript_60289/m.197180 type:complete len:256 (-) Transcript_60289:224-991(-)
MGNRGVELRYLIWLGPRPHLRAGHLGGFVLPSDRHLHASVAHDHGVGAEDLPGVGHVRRAAGHAGHDEHVFTSVGVVLHDAGARPEVELGVAAVLRASARPGGPRAAAALVLQHPGAPRGTRGLPEHATIPPQGATLAAGFLGSSPGAAEARRPEHGGGLEGAVVELGMEGQGLLGSTLPQREGVRRHGARGRRKEVALRGGFASLRRRRRRLPVRARGDVDQRVPKHPNIPVILQAEACRIFSSEPSLPRRGAE